MCPPRTRGQVWKDDTGSRKQGENAEGRKESPEGQCQEVLPERYCGLQVCVAPDSSVRREGLWKVPELRWAVRVGPTVRQGTSLTRGWKGREDTSRKAAVCKPPGESYQTHNADTLILDFQPPEL